MKMLLHACCGPCSIEPSRLLQEKDVEFSIYFANSNIHPADEYKKRLDTIVAHASNSNIAFIEGEYQPEEWEKSVGIIGERLEAKKAAFGLSDHLVPSPNPYPLPPVDTEAIDTFTPSENTRTAEAAFQELADLRAARCRACYRLRFEETCRYAQTHGFECVGSTLSVSPFQYTEIIKEELERATKLYNLQNAFVDYREHFETNEKRSVELGMYRQNFCGCHFSDMEAQQERAIRKAWRKAQRKARKEAKRELTRE